MAPGREAARRSGAGGLEGKVVGEGRDDDGVHLIASFRAGFPGDSRCDDEPTGVRGRVSRVGRSVGRGGRPVGRGRTGAGRVEP
ncbi:hypothetical protein JQN58_33110 [Aneurinibacillus sp. BA2021]|nr:hypothetical protein [Aneurinibacillus sp. BA2021]